MTGDDLLIRAAGDDDEPAIVDLIRASLGEGSIPRTRAFWRWKHRSNPFGESPVLVAEAEGRIVGLRAFLRWRWRVGNRDVSAVRAVDTGTHPDWRGRGIFTRLTLALRDRMAAEGVGFVYNTPNDKSRPGYLKMGWEVVGRPTLWIRPVHPVRLARALADRGLSGDELAPPELDAPPAGEVLEEPEVGALLQSRSSSRPGRYHTGATLEYLRWRYAGIPGIAYHALRRGGGQDGALVIMRSRRRGRIRELRLCEVIAGSTREAKRNAGALLGEAAGIGGLDVVVLMAPPALPVHVLLGRGYLPTPGAGPTLTAFRLNLPAGAPDPVALRSWAPSIGDLELF